MERTGTVGAVVGMGFVSVILCYIAVDSIQPCTIQSMPQDTRNPEDNTKTKRTLVVAWVMAAQ